VQYRRNREGLCYFFTVVSDRRRPILTLPENIARLRRSFKEAIKRRPFRLIAIVVLPDHLHAIWELPQADPDYSGRWAYIKRHFSTGAIAAGSPSENQQRRRELAVWQKRFWEHRIRDDEDLARHLDYIHYNPVKHGLVNSPWDWPHSSLKRCAALGWYAANWGLCVDDVRSEPSATGE